MRIYSWQTTMYDKTNLTEYFRDLGYEVLHKQVFKTRRTYALAKKEGLGWAKISDAEYASMSDTIQSDYPGSIVTRMEGLLIPDGKTKSSLKVQVPLTRSPEMTEREMRTFLINKGFSNFYLTRTQRKGSFHFAPEGEFSDEDEQRLKEAAREVGYRLIKDAHETMRTRLFNMQDRGRKYKLVRQIVG